MKVLIVHNRYREAGGEDAAVAAERALLAAHGHETALFTVSNDAVAGLGGRIAAAWRAPYAAAARDRLAARIEAERPAIVHIHNFFPLLSPAVYDACRAAGAPVVQTLHNYRLICPGALLLRDGRVCEDCVTGSPYRAAIYGCYRGSRLGSLAVARMLARHRRRGTWRTQVDRFIALTAFARRKFIEGGLPADRIAVKPNFVMNDPGPPTAKARRGALYVGRLSPEKGVLTLLEAWRGIDYPLRVVGDGPLAARLRAEAPANVAILGPRPPAAVAEEMARAAFLVAPSVCYEGFPMVIAEAYAHGLPVLAADLGGLAEIVEDGVTGRRFAPGDAAALAACVARLRAAPEDCARMGAQARARFEARYTAAANYRMLRAIYDEALESRVGERARVIGAPVAACRFDSAVARIMAAAREGRGGYVCVANVHMATEARRAPALLEAMENALLCVSDGMPLVWSLRRQGYTAERVAGPDLMAELCARAAAEGLPIYLYGGDAETLARLKARLCARFPGLVVAGAEAPPRLPAHPGADGQAAARIRASGARLVFVALGCPKQELWMAANAPAIPAVLLGVGAAFGFLAGVRARAPRWMQRAGLEWLFRLISEPRRLWRRYLTTNSRYIADLARTRLSGR